jgi:Lrp/AsnC family transcriptional regulator for asnA, asnC and gidA
MLDETDRKILISLVNNARTPFLEIARDCGISGGVVHQRIKKMEDAGIITGSQFTVHPESLGYDVCAFIWIELTETSMYSEVVKKLSHVSEVVECHYVTGEYDVLVKIYCKNKSHLLSVVADKVQKIHGVSKTCTSISLDRAFERQINIENENIVNQKDISNE